MKIVHLTTVAASHRYLLLPQLLALAEAGHEVVAVSAPGPETAVLDRYGIRHRPLAGSTRGFDLRADLKAARSFVQILRDERPDLVHTHNPKPGVYGRVLSRVFGVERVVNTVHGLYATPDDPLRRRLAVYGMEAVASRFSHIELVQNAEDMELMAAKRIASGPKLRHLGNGIDTASFTPDRASACRAEVRAELGIGRDELVVGSVGRLVIEKGFGELLAASASIGTPHRLVVVGPSDPEKADALPQSLIDEATARGVRFLGERDDIDRLLGAFDLFVLASYREGIPRAAMEAAASGLPIVATDIRGCRQVVDDGVNGALVPKADPHALATAIESMLSDSDLRRRHGQAGRIRAVANFDERDVVGRLVDAYRELGITPVHGSHISAAA